MTAPSPQRAASAEEHNVPTGFARLVSNLIHEAFDGVDPVPPHVEAAIDRMEVALIGIVNADREASATMEAGAMRVVAEALEHWSTFLSKSNGIQEWVRQAVGALNYARKREAEIAPLLDRITAAEARAEEAERSIEQKAREVVACGLPDDAKWLLASKDRWHAKALAATADRDRLADEVAHWKRIVVEAVIPLEAMQAAGRTADFSPELRAGVEHAIAVVRRALTVTGGTTDGQA